MGWREHCRKGMPTWWTSIPPPSPEEEVYREQKIQENSYFLRLRHSKHVLSFPPGIAESSHCWCWCSWKGEEEEAETKGPESTAKLSFRNPFKKTHHAKHLGLKVFQRTSTARFPKIRTPPSWRTESTLFFQKGLKTIKRKTNKKNDIEQAIQQKKRIFQEGKIESFGDEDFIAAAKEGEWEKLREILGRHPGYAQPQEVLTPKPFGRHRNVRWICGRHIDAMQPFTRQDWLGEFHRGVFPDFLVRGSNKTSDFQKF